MTLEETMSEFESVYEDLEKGNRLDPQEALLKMARALKETIQHTRNLTYLYQQLNPIITSEDIDNIKGEFE